MRLTYFDSLFHQVNTESQLVPQHYVRIMCALEGSLQLL